MDDADRLRTAQAERLAALRAAVADTPAHARYLDALLAADTAAGDAALDAVPVPPGVSVKVAWALVEDVAWCRAPAPARGYMAPFPDAYPTRRLAIARANAARRAARERRAASERRAALGGLADLLGLPDNESENET